METYTYRLRLRFWRGHIDVRPLEQCIKTKVILVRNISLAQASRNLDQLSMRYRGSDGGLAQGGVARRDMIFLARQLIIELNSRFGSGREGQ